MARRFSLLTFPTFSKGRVRGFTSVKMWEMYGSLLWDQPRSLRGVLDAVKKTIFSYVLCVMLLSSSALAAEEYKFDLSEIEKKPYHLGGYGELRPVLFALDRNVALYRLKFYNRDEGRTIEEYNFRLQLEGSYERGIARVFARVNGDLSYTYQGRSDDTRLYEGFLSLKPYNSFTLDIGKKTIKWGKGYAWNPVAFIDRPKDPDEPDLALEGFWVVSTDFIKSFSGPLKTASLTPVLMPVLKDINDEFGIQDRINAAAKLYLLLYDTDIDFIVFTGGSRTTRYGIDFSRNIRTNFEIHGELAYIQDYKKRYIDKTGNALTSDYNAKSYLLGIRYLTQKDLTYILEYYRNDTGFTKDEMGDYFSFIDLGYRTYLSSRNDALLRKALNVTEGNYGRPNPMRDYLYLRVSQKEPFDILYFTPSMTGILNLNDHSFSISPEFLYTGITNLELRLKAIFLLGGDNSEYGEKQNNHRIELRVRYYF